MSEITRAEITRVYEEVQRRKDEASAALRGDPEQTRKLARKLYGRVADELPDVATGPAVAHTLEGIAWVARLLHEADIDTDELEAVLGVVDSIERNTAAHIRELGGVMTPVQGVSAGIGAGFFTGLWMGVLLRDERLTDALRTALDAMVHRPPDSSLYVDAIRTVRRVLYPEDWEEPE